MTNQKPPSLSFLQHLRIRNARKLSRNLMAALERLPLCEMATFVAQLADDVERIVAKHQPPKPRSARRKLLDASDAAQPAKLNRKATAPRPRRKPATKRMATR